MFVLIVSDIDTFDDVADVYGPFDTIEAADAYALSFDGLAVRYAVEPLRAPIPVQA